MVSTLQSTWSEVSVLNTTIGDDFDSVWTFGNDLIFSQIGFNNSTTYLQLVEFNGTNYTVSNVMPANSTASFELEIVSGKLVISVIDGSYLSVYERDINGEIGVFSIKG